MIPIGFLSSQSFADAELSYTDLKSTTANQTVYTWTGVDFGAASTNRVIAIIIGNQTGLSSVTIGGINATIVGSNFNYIAYAVVPTGTTGTIVITNTSGDSRNGIWVFRIIPGKSTTPYLSTNTTTLAQASPNVTLEKGSVTLVNASRNTGDSNNGLRWTGSAIDFTIDHRDFGSSSYCWSAGWTPDVAPEEETDNFYCSFKSVKYVIVSWR
jgi:hypothetical protein